MKDAQFVEEELQELTPGGTLENAAGAHVRHNAISVAFEDVRAYGFSQRSGYQKTVASFMTAYVQRAWNTIRRVPESRIDILKGIEAVVEPGEMLLVLGRPGSGCSTLLKTLAGQTHGFNVDSGSKFNFQGVPCDIMHGKLRGKCVYLAELDFHFPTLTMRETLEFGAKVRKSAGDSEQSRRRAEATAAQLGLAKALETNMGNDLVPGVSGGERKRASIAEILVGDSNFQCWDNSTRGLDSQNALDFVKTLRESTTQRKSVAIVTLYQAGEEIYKLFDKVLVLHEGHQIYFGPTKTARSYFTDLGLNARTWSSTPDFLTSVTTPKGRLLRPGYKDQVPNTAEDYATQWGTSGARSRLRQQIRDYNAKHRLMTSGVLEQHSENPKILPYAISLWKQITLCAMRGLLRMKNDLNAPISAIVGNLVISIILGSMFYNQNEDTSSFTGRGVLLFITVFLNTSLAGFECILVWEARPMIEKQLRYAFYRPLAEAVSSLIVDLPNKLLLTLFFNLPLYFLANLRRTPGAFFTFYLFALVALLNGSMIFRAMGAMSKTSEGSQPPGAVFSMLLMLYSGFVVPFDNMRPWLQWFSYINPVYYGFESLVINEFSGRSFPCALYVPDYDELSSEQRACNAVGSVPGSDFVLGDAYMYETWKYLPSHLWRNLGIMIALMVLYGSAFIICSELISLQPSRGEILLFRKKDTAFPARPSDEESNGSTLVPRQGLDQVREKSEVYDAGHMAESDAATFVWKNLTYTIKVKKAEKKILDDVEGWVMPRTMTALMGASGAGKTTLLNVLAERTTIGVVEGDRHIATHLQDLAFARRIGYVQQQDLHMNTMTVREAFNFSARLRQPARYSDAQKLHWVNTVISLLDIRKDGFEDAVIGVPGEGLNIEQRKRVTIGVELAARPDLLLFLDEPTSGLDSDFSLSIIKILRRLADHGQAIMCVIHQPSAPLLSHFDQLLLLSEGKSVYFGPLGRQFETVIDYFQSNGARHLVEGENPAAWLIDVSGSSANDDKNSLNWIDIWSKAPQRQSVLAECNNMQKQLAQEEAEHKETASSEFASSFWQQLLIVSGRAIIHDWRSPTYIWSKLLSTFGLTFINGVSFWRAGFEPQAIRDQVFSLFVLTTIFGAHVQLIMKRFHESRVLYEARERHSRTFSWVVFLSSNILVELISQTVVSVIAYVCWYYPIGSWQNADALGQLNERGGLTFLFLWSLMILYQTMSQMLMTIMPDVPTGINIANLLFMLSLIFSGVLVSPSALPRFWIFMYRATPLSYFISGIMSVSLAGVEQINCAEKDFITFPSTSNGTSCESFLADYSQRVPIHILNPTDNSDCNICPYGSTDSMLAGYGIFFSQRWRNWGITVAYSVINVGLTYLLWRLTKVTKAKRKL